MENGIGPEDLPVLIYIINKFNNILILREIKIFCVMVKFADPTVTTTLEKSINTKYGTAGTRETTKTTIIEALPPSNSRRLFIGDNVA